MEEKKTLESCARLCNSILKDELAQLVRTPNKWDQVHGPWSRSVTRWAVSFARSARLSRLAPTPGAGYHPSPEDRDQTGNPNRRKSIITLENQRTDGPNPSSSTAAVLVHCLYIHRTKLMTVPMSCSMHATDHKRFLILCEFWEKSIIGAF